MRLVGAVPHERMPTFYSAADLFVVGSHHEGSGYSVMEACACGAVPVVTEHSDVPAAHRQRIDRRAVDARTTPTAARVRSPTSAGAISIAERARLADHFARELSWDAVGRRAMEIYEQVLGARRSGLAVQLGLRTSCWRLAPSAQP